MAKKKKKGDGKVVSLTMQTRSYDQDAGLLLRAESLNEKERTVDLVWTTGARVLLNGFLPDGSDYGRYYEELSLADGAVNLKRLNNGAPLLKDHIRRSIDSVVGVVVDNTARLNGGLGTATTKFSDRHDAEEVFRDVRSGVLRNISVGYSVEEYQVTRKEGDIPVFLATKWTPKEISIVSIGADDAAGFRSEGNEGENRCVILNSGDEPMSKKAAGDDKERKSPKDQKQTETVEKERGSEVAQPQVVDDDKLRAEIRGQERQRADDIRAVVNQANLEGSYADELIGRKDCSLDDARAIVLDELATRSGKSQVRSAVTFTDRESGDDPSVIRERMAEAVACRYTGEAPSDKVREFTNLSMMELSGDLLSARGETVRGVARGQLVERALSTSDLPILLQSVGNRILLPSYELVPTTYKRIAKKQNLKDFRSQALVRDGDFPEFLPLGEGGELKSGALSESDESIKLGSFGRKLKFTRQALINDDLGSFASMIQKIGQAAARFENQKVWNIVISNIKLASGKTLFHASHKNLAAAGSVINVTSVGAGKKAIRTQKNESGSVLNYTPSILAVPSDLETVSEQYLSKLVLPTKTDDIVPGSHKQLELLVEPELDKIDDIAWHLFVNPSLLASVIYSNLEGQEGPQIRLDNASLTGADYEVILDFAAAPVDFRGVYRNPGAAPA